MPATIYHLDVIRDAAAKAASRELVPVSPRQNAIANAESLLFEAEKLVALLKSGYDTQGIEKIFAMQNTLRGVVGLLRM